MRKITILIFFLCTRQLLGMEDSTVQQLTTLPPENSITMNDTIPLVLKTNRQKWKEECRDCCRHEFAVCCCSPITPTLVTVFCLASSAVVPAAICACLH